MLTTDDLTIGGPRWYPAVSKIAYKESMENGYGRKKVGYCARSFYDSFPQYRYVPEIIFSYVNSFLLMIISREKG